MATSSAASRTVVYRWGLYVDSSDNHFVADGVTIKKIQYYKLYIFVMSQIKKNFVQQWHAILFFFAIVAIFPYEVT